MFRLAAAPRELKLYLKTGLKFAQEHCLALRSARLLVEMAQFSLLCDDEQAAEVHLEGTQFILASVLEADKTAVKVCLSNILYIYCLTFFIFLQVKSTDNSRVVTLPGQEDLSMSPNLIRHNNNPPQVSPWLSLSAVIVIDIIASISTIPPPAPVIPAASPSSTPPSSVSCSPRPGASC